VRRLATVTLVALVPLFALAACGSSSPSASPSAPGSAASSAPAAPAFNPCDGLDPAPVSTALGARLKVTTGTADAPRCALLPVAKGGPTFELSYLWFDGGLDAAWKTMQIPAGTVSEPHIAGADDAREVAQQTSSALAVSAFLQNGALIQSVNGLALAPYRAGRMQRAIEAILTQLSAKAPTS
jgi:predicted small lipoprotein YifL